MQRRKPPVKGIDLTVQLHPGAHLSHVAPLDRLAQRWVNPLEADTEEIVRVVEVASVPQTPSPPKTHPTSKNPTSPIFTIFFLSIPSSPS
jgi:hypothetical protein